MSHTIQELLAVSAANRESNWLRKSLQTAIEIEFSTLPLYLTAYWSIDTSGTGDPDDVAGTIMSIALEEMLHMGLACNMLVAIGGAPKINQHSTLPLFPGHLPGGVHPNLQVALRRLTPSQVDAFMGIENPAHRPVVTETGFQDNQHTIGQFYDAIKEAFDLIRPPLSTTHQLDVAFPPNIGDLFKVHSLSDVHKAINKIKHQGEGFSNSPDEAKPGAVVAHYYRFAEVHHGARLKQDPVSHRWSYSGNLVQFPKVFPLADIPPGGYSATNVPAADWVAISADITQFDQAFSDMLNHLQAAWQNGSPSELSSSVSAMGDLTNPATNLMSIPITGGSGATYGPCFRLVP